MKRLYLAFALALLVTGICSCVDAHSGDVVVAVYSTTPTMDGALSSGEWDDASTVAFDVKDGQ